MGRSQQHEPFMSAHKLLVSLLMVYAGCSTPAFADDDKDESGHGRKRGGGHSFKEEYWDGNCKVERKLEKNGDYKEERKCKGGHRPHAHAPVVQQPAVVVYPPWIVVEQGRPHHYRSGYEPAPAPVAQGDVSVCNSETVGRVLGGIAGAVLGNQVGKGTGRAVATIGGGIAGVLVGGEVGRRMDAGNQACVGQTLEVAPTGKRVQWQADGTQYAVVPGAAVQRNGTYCRPYDAQVRTPSGWQVTRGTACRRADGVWVQTR
jgi:surface antigen